MKASFKEMALALRWFGGYAVWVWASYLLITTFVTYLTIRSHSSGGPVSSFEDIHEALNLSTLPLLGISCLAFVLTVHTHPSLNVRDFFSQRRIQQRFLPGLTQGALYGAMFLVALLVTRVYQWYGIIFRFEEVVPAAFSLLSRSIGLVILIYLEEYLFRVRIYSALKALKSLKGWVPAIITSALYVVIKWVQFGMEDLGVLQSTTLFILSLNLCRRYDEQKDFALGAGFFSGMVLVFHALVSLPIYGFDFTGIGLIKYHSDESFRLISGGPGGPLSSIALQFLLVLDTLRGRFVRK